MKSRGSPSGAICSILSGGKSGLQSSQDTSVSPPEARGPYSVRLAERRITGLKPDSSYFRRFSARLKSCPDTKQKRRHLRGLSGRAIRVGIAKMAEFGRISKCAIAIAEHDFVIVVIARDPRSAMPSLLKSAVVQETSEDRVPAV